MKLSTVNYRFISKFLLKKSYLVKKKESLKIGQISFTYKTISYGNVNILSIFSCAEQNINMSDSKESQNTNKNKVYFFLILTLLILFTINGSLGKYTHNPLVDLVISKYSLLDDDLLSQNVLRYAFEIFSLL